MAMIRSNTPLRLRGESWESQYLVDHGVLRFRLYWPTLLSEPINPAIGTNIIFSSRGIDTDTASLRVEKETLDVEFV